MKVYFDILIINEIDYNFSFLEFNFKFFVNLVF